MIRLNESIRLDHQAEGETEQYSLSEYRQVLVFAVNTHAEDTGDLTINDGAGGTEIASITLESGQEGYISINSEKITDDDGEIEIVTDAEVLATVMRGDSRYRPVEQDVDESEVVT